MYESILDGFVKTELQHVWPLRIFLDMFDHSFPYIITPVL